MGWTVLNENSEKADAALAEREKDVLTLAANLGTAGKNARIAWGAYTGNEKCGSANLSSLTFDFCPVAVMIGSAENVDTTTWPTILLRGCAKTCSDFSSANTMTVTWLDKGIRWYCADHSSGQDNDNNTVYYYCVVGCDNS